MLTQTLRKMRSINAAGAWLELGWNDARRAAEEEGYRMLWTNHYSLPHAERHEH
jgi:hypothetical protein